MTPKTRTTPRQPTRHRGVLWVGLPWALALGGLVLGGLALRRAEQAHALAQAATVAPALEDHLRIRRPDGSVALELRELYGSLCLRLMHTNGGEVALSVDAYGAGHLVQSEAGENNSPYDPCHELP